MPGGAIDAGVVDGVDAGGAVGVVGVVGVVDVVDGGGVSPVGTAAMLTLPLRIWTLNEAVCPFRAKVMVAPDWVVVTVEGQLEEIDWIASVPFHVATETDP